MLTYKQWVELGIENIVPPLNFIQIKHLDAKVSVDLKNKSLKMVVNYTCQKFPQGSNTIIFDGINFDFEYLKINNKNSKFDYDGKKLLIRLTDEVSNEFQITASYKVKPKLGFYFIEQENDIETWTQGEAQDNKHWLLSIDYPNQKFTASIEIEVPKGYTAVSNGRLYEVKEYKNIARFNYKMDWPVTSYLIAIACGKFEKHYEKVEETTLNYYYSPRWKKIAKQSFKETPKILKFFNEKIKYKYPHTSYSQIVISSFMYGGMENTTTTFLTEFFLFDETTKEFLQEDARGLIAHEFAHQWWGDTLTCKNWKHIWLNESFVTYWDALYTENQYGKDEFQRQLIGNLESYLEESKTFQRPIVPPDFVDPALMFDRHTYPKGALVLHTLRNYVGDTVFFNTLTHYINKNQHKCVETVDLIKAFEEVAGKDLNEFFDTWVFKPGHPQLELKSSWNQKEKVFTIKIEQQQDINTTPIYKLCLPIKLYTVKNNTPKPIKEDVLTLTSKEDTFYFKLEEEPAFYEVDPDFTSLKTLKINYTLKELNNMLQYSKSHYTYYLYLNNIGSISYSEELVEKMIKNIVDKTVFFGTKILLLQALEKFPTKFVEEKLKSIYEKISDLRVKNQIIRTLSTFRSTENYNFFKDILSYEKNPYLVGSTLLGIAELEFADNEKSEAIKTVKRYLNFPSLHNIIASQAYKALGKFRDEKLIADFVNGYTKTNHRYVKYGIVEGLAEYSVFDNYIADKALFYLKKILSDEKDILVRRKIITISSKFGSKAVPLISSAVENEIYSTNKVTAKMALEQVKSMDKKQDIELLKKEVEKIKFENKLLKEKVDSIEKKLKK